MTLEEIEALFTRADGSYLFARWGRPICPVVFGVEDATLSVLKGACEAVVALARHQMAETDPELGANLMVFFCRDWAELIAVPGLVHLVQGLEALVARLDAEQASTYRAFRFDKDGAIQAAFVFLRIDAALADLPAETLALDQMVRVIVTWSETAFAERSPLALTEGGATVLRPDVAEAIRAGYDPVMPLKADNPAHALRLFARIGQRAQA